MLENDHLFVSFRTSKAYLYFNRAQLVLTLLLLGCFFTSSHELLSILQILVAFCLSLDIIIRYFADKEFIRQPGNIYDIVLLVVIVITMTLDIVLPVRFHRKADLFTLVFIGIRYSTQLVRFFMILKKTHDVKMMQGLKQISFHGMGQLGLEQQPPSDKHFNQHLLQGMLP